MHYEAIATLEAFVAEVQSRLMSKTARFKIDFPIQHVAPWNGDALAAANSGLLSSLSGRANLYALFILRPGSTDTALVYIGKTTKKLSRQRLTNHLFRRNERTGSKLDLVRQEVQAGAQLEVSWVPIEPESLRNYLEEELILAHPQAIWNRENRASVARDARPSLEPEVVGSATPTSPGAV